MHFSNPNKLARPSRKAFTLLEILAVVSIITVLALLLLPTLREQVQKSRQAKLAFNMRTIANGVIQYANDNGGRLPASSQPEGSWQTVVSEYLGQTRILSVPELYKASSFHDPLDTVELPYHATKRASLNIALNGMARFTNTPSGSIPPTPSGASYRVLASISQPSKLLLMTTGETQLDSYSGYCMRLNSNAFRKPADPSILTRIPGKHMCGFVDGHTELLPIEEILTEAEKDRASISTSVFFDNRANNGEGVP